MEHDADVLAELPPRHEPARERQVRAARAKGVRDVLKEHGPGRTTPSLGERPAGAAGSARMAAMAAPIAALSPTGVTRRPFTPSVSHSEMPPLSKATAGTPRAAASRPTRPKGSGQMLGTASRIARLRSSARACTYTHPGTTA